MDAFGRFIAIMVAVVLILLFPLQYIAQHQSENIDSVIYTHTTEFTDMARQQGYITKEMYENYIVTLDATGELYDVEFEVAHPVSGKEVAKLTIGDEMPEDITQHTSVKKSVISQYTERRERTSEDEIFSLATHTHTVDCYAGHRHTTSCVPSGYMGGKVISNYNYSRSGNTNYYFVTVRCATCLKDLFYFNYSQNNDYYSIQGQSQWVQYNEQGIPGSYGWAYKSFYIYQSTSQSIYNAFLGKAGAFLQYISLYHGGTRIGGDITSNPFMWDYGGYPIWDTAGNPLTNTPYIGCPYCGNYGDNYSCGQILDENPICNQVVTGITATSPSQTVNIKSGIITTATATYLNGATKTVNCTSNYNPNVVGTQTVTLTYSGLVGNAKTNGTRTCAMQVIVKDTNVLKAIAVTPTSQSRARYSEPIFIVNAVYQDGTNKEVSNYTITGYNKNILGAQTVTIAYQENGLTKTATAIVIITSLTKTCQTCHTVYNLTTDDIDPGCPTCNSILVDINTSQDYVKVAKGDTLPITVTATYQSGRKGIVNGWTSDFDASKIGIQQVKITYQNLTTYVLVDVSGDIICPVCGQAYELLEEGSNLGCPTCKQTVVSISASPQNISIVQYQEFDLSVTATFRDGHSETVTEWATDLAGDTIGTFEVTVFYQAATDHITVTVLEEGLVECPICFLKYSIKENPRGCPICTTKIVSIEASLRNDGTQVLYGSDIYLQLVLIYQDNHKALVYSGWTVEGYDATVLGEQTVTVYYGALSTTLTIEVVTNQAEVTCPYGHIYYLNEDGSDPGCPYCELGRNKDNAIFYFDITYTTEIMNALYDTGRYNLQSGDYLTITVTPRNTSLRFKLQNMFFRTSLAGRSEKFTLGGEVTY